MWYWDFAPPSGHHAKKPLTKKQLDKIKAAYEKWGMIAEHVKRFEEKEEIHAKKQIEQDLHSAFL